MVVQGDYYRMDPLVMNQCKTGVNIFPNVHAFCVGIVSKYLGQSFKELVEPLKILVESGIKTFRILIGAKSFSNVVFLDKEFQKRL